MADPIPDELQVVMKKVGNVLGSVLSNYVGRKMGFALLVFDFGEGGTMSFISNAQREHMVHAMRELADNIEKDKDDEKSSQVEI